MSPNKKLVFVFAVVAALSAVFYFDLIDWGEKGTYEYVRKGKKYIEEGKYDKALLLLHQAFVRSLPVSRGSILRPLQIICRIRHLISILKRSSILPTQWNLNRLKQKRFHWVS